METSIGALLLSGLSLMLIGMGIVFLFLSLLVWIIHLTARLINRYSPELIHGMPSPQPVFAPEKVETDELELVAAISAAIHRHQNPS